MKVLGARRDANLAHKGAQCNDRARLLGEGAKLAPAVLQKVIEVDVVDRPLADHADHLHIQPLRVREDVRIQGVAEKGPDLLEKLGLDDSALLAGLVVEVDEIDVIAEAHHHALVLRALDRDIVGDGVVLGKLLVDALVDLENGIEVGARNGVEKAVDLVLEHVLREGGKRRGHLCGAFASLVQPFCISVHSNLKKWRRSATHL